MRVIGHGIDTGRFSPDPGPPLRKLPPTILAVGRLSPIKNYEMLIDAASVLVKEHGLPGVDVRIVGGDEGNAPPGYARSLQSRIDRLGLQAVVRLVGPVAYDRMSAEYRAATVAANLCPTGGMDKAVLEGMAAGLPTLVRNATFRPVFGQDADTLVLPEAEADARAVAARLALLLGWEDHDRRALGMRLRERAVDEFGQAALVGRLAAQLFELKRASGSGPAAGPAGRDS